MAKVDWTAERISALTVKQLRQLLDNAIRLDDQQVVSLCEADLKQRSPQKSHSARKERGTKSKGSYVTGFHFVCENDAGVTQNPDGTFWTGSWVVDAAHAEYGVSIGGYVALHSSKAEPSYRQGTIKGWRKTTRDRGKIEDRIEFLIEPTAQPIQWVGRGAGEKGYARGPQPSKADVG